MIVGAAILFMALKPTAAQIFNPDSNCTYNHMVEFPQKITLESPGWPASYRSSQTCRWMFHCPVGHYCRMQCEVKLPHSDYCSEDKVLVSRLGNNQFIGATTYCGQTIIDSKSLNQKLAVGLITSKNSPGGKFKCQVIAESVRTTLSTIIED